MKQSGLTFIICVLYKQQQEKNLFCKNTFNHSHKLVVIIIAAPRALSSPQNYNWQLQPMAEVDLPLRTLWPTNIYLLLRFLNFFCFHCDRRAKHTVSFKLSYSCTRNVEDGENWLGQRGPDLEEGTTAGCPWHR